MKSKTTPGRREVSKFWWLVVAYLRTRTPPKPRTKAALVTLLDPILPTEWESITSFRRGMRAFRESTFALSEAYALYTLGDFIKLCESRHVFRFPFHAPELEGDVDHKKSFVAVLFDSIQAARGAQSRSPLELPMDRQWTVEQQAVITVVNAGPGTEC